MKSILYTILFLFSVNFSFTQCYMADCLKCTACWGHYIYSDGLYSGYFQEGRRRGRGTFVDDSFNRYDGDWLNDQRHGKGVYTWGQGQWQGDEYEGDWISGERTGWGKYTSKNGNILEGYFENGIFKGNNSSSQNITTTSNSNNQTVNSDQNIWKEEAIKALNNRKVNIISNSSQKRCSWCSNSINCTKKTDAQMKVEIISSKWVTQLLVMGILSEGDLEKKSKNPMFTLLINSPIEIELYDCPKFCSRKCEYDSNKAGQKK